MRPRYGIWATAALAALVVTSCLRTEVLGTEGSAVVACEPDACSGTEPAACGDRSARCTRAKTSTACEWEAPDCAPPEDAGMVCESGVPLTANGPWDAVRGCWPLDVRTFECVEAVGGLGALTCFHELSSGQYYLAPTSTIPSGANYRLCTDEENDAGRWMAKFCP